MYKIFKNIKYRKTFTPAADSSTTTLLRLRPSYQLGYQRNLKILLIKVEMGNKA